MKNLELLELKARILLSFYRAEEKHCSVTGLARTFEIEKYQISRVLGEMEAEGHIDRTDHRNPRLTVKGMEKAKQYDERITLTMNHLLYEGVDVQSAAEDALHWAILNSERTMDAIRDTAERYRVKYALRQKQEFTGTELCSLMQDGSYKLSFILYREHVKDGCNISMGNEGFEHPCILEVKNGRGTICLRVTEVQRKSPLSGKLMTGKVKLFRYMDGKKFYDAECNADSVRFPASVLKFVNMGTGAAQLLHGSVCVRMISSVGKVHMPESTAIFTILI